MDLFGASGQVGTWRAIYSFQNFTCMFGFLSLYLMMIWCSYWNSRLATERQRLVNDIFRDSDVVCKLQPCILFSTVRLLLLVESGPVIYFAEAALSHI